MLGVTFFGLFLTPVFYVALRQLVGNRRTDHVSRGDTSSVQADQL
jgi:hypothetical protein